MMVLGKDIPLPDSPAAKLGAWVFAIAGGTLGAWLWLDSYFVHRAEAQAMKAEYTAQIAQIAQNSTAQTAELRLQIEYSADQNAKRQIDNTLFQLEQIPPAQMKPQDRALYSKLLRDRQELVNLWNRRGRPLR
jgi:hypothetical protein